MDFLANVQKVEVHFNPQQELGWPFRSYKNPWSWSKWPLCYRNSRCDQFWQTLQHRLPRAVCIVLSWSENDIEHPISTLPEDMITMADMCSADLNISISFLRVVDHPNILQRVLRQKTQTRDIGKNVSTWWETDSPWKRIGVLPPPKSFSGPVGSWICFNYHRTCVRDQERAMQILGVEAMERDHFVGQHKPFKCTYPECDVQIEEPGQLKMHAMISRHAEFPPMPVETSQYYELLNKIPNEFQNPMFNLNEEWGELSSPQRLQKKGAFFDQLRTDPSHALSDSEEWDRWRTNFEGFLRVPWQTLGPPPANNSTIPEPSEFHDSSAHL